MLPTFAYIGQTELLIVGGIVLVLFGGSKIPQLAKGLGEGIREFKKSMTGEGSENASPSASDTQQQQQHPVSPATTETATSAK